MSVFLHEAGHTICALARGVRVESVRATEVNGEVVPVLGADVDPTDRLVLAMGGEQAVRSVTTPGSSQSGNLSRGDQGYIEKALSDAEESGHLPDIDACRREARAIIDEHVEAVVDLAAELEKRTYLGRAAIAELCHRPDSSLSAFAHLYPKPSSKPKPAAPSLSPRAVRVGAASTLAVGHGAYRVQVDRAIR